MPWCPIVGKPRAVYAAIDRAAAGGPRWLRCPVCRRHVQLRVDRRTGAVIGVTRHHPLRTG